MTDTDVDAVKELQLYVDNTEHVYREKWRVMLKLAERKANGTYDQAKAPRAFSHLVGRAAREYHMEHGGAFARWFDTFTMDVRRAVCAEFVQEFSDEYALGNIPTKESNHE